MLQTFKLKVRHKPPTVNTKIEPAPFRQKSPAAYTYKSGLRTEFTMTKRILELRDNNMRPLYMQPKFILACLMTSAIKVGKYPTVLTSVRRMTEHFGMTRRQIVQALHILQNTQVHGINIIDYHPYDAWDAIQQLNDTSKKTRLYSDLKLDVKQAQVVSKDMQFMLHKRHSERFIEIQISAYEHIKYDSKRPGDFFFDVQADLYRELDVTKRVLLFMIQSRIAQNINKKMQEKSIVRVNTFAKYLNFDMKYIQKVLQALHDDRYIAYVKEKDIMTITLTDKGSRKIRRFEDGSVKKYSRENRKKMEEEKAKKKARKKTRLPVPPENVLREQKASEYAGRNQYAQDGRVPNNTSSLNEQKKQDKQEQAKPQDNRSDQETKCVPGSAEDGRRKLEEIRQQWAQRKETEQDTWTATDYAAAEDNTIRGIDHGRQAETNHESNEEHFKKMLDNHNKMKLEHMFK